jgi:hypothetical protein
MMPGAGGDVNTTLPLVFSIISVIPCCSGIFFLLGIVALIFSIQANNAKKTGDMETARGKSKTALIMAIAAIVLGLLQGIGWSIVNNL